MRRGAAASFLIVISLATAGGLDAVRADQNSQKDAVIARVGSTEITVRAMEQRIKSLPDFQLATLGASAAEQRRSLLDQVVIKEALFAEAAKQRKLDQTSPTRERIDDALRVARLDALKGEVAVSPAEIAAFYVDNQVRFDSPERIAVYRILCPTHEIASTVIAEAKQSGTLLRWNELARDQSTDKATSLRGGSLGFIAADGSSNEPSVRVDPVLFVAAGRLKDGEIASEPVKEGDGFAVVWRRGSMPAVHRTIEDETNAIRQVLERKKVEDSIRALLKQLRSERHVEVQPQLIELVDVDSDGSVVQKKRPGVVPHKPAQPPAPSSTPRGLR